MNGRERARIYEHVSYIEEKREREKKRKEKFQSFSP